MEIPQALYNHLSSDQIGDGDDWVRVIGRVALSNWAVGASARDIRTGTTLAPSTGSHEFFAIT